MPILGLGINPARRNGHLFPCSPGCERAAMPNVFAIAAFYKRHRAGRYGRGAFPRLATLRKSEPMLFWIAAIGSTWGAYALGFERVIASARSEAPCHGGRESRTAEDGRRKTDSNG